MRSLAGLFLTWDAGQTVALHWTIAGNRQNVVNHEIANSGAVKYACRFSEHEVAVSGFVAVHSFGTQLPFCSLKIQSLFLPLVGFLCCSTAKRFLLAASLLPLLPTT